jgi:hypothetical protein
MGLVPTLGWTTEIRQSDAPLALGQAGVNFSGDWQGTGQLQGPGNRKSPCSKIRIKIDHRTGATPEVLTVQLYDATCGLYGPEWGPYPFEIREGKVYEGGEETGALEGSVFRTTSSDGGVQYRFDLQLQNGASSADDLLRSSYGVRNGMGTIVIDGVLSRTTRSE